MFKKENAQFYVGAAVGVTVGLCVGKLLSSNIKSNNIENGQIDNLSANDKHNCRTRSRSASQYIDNNQENSTFLMAPLIKPTLSDSNININSEILMKKMQLNELSSICEPCKIINKKENLSQNRNAHFFNVFCSHNVEEKITHDIALHTHEKIISNNWILKSKSLNMKKNIPEYTSLEYPSDNFDQTNMGVCNTITDVKQADLSSTSNNCESLDIEQYNKFSEHNLISSTMCDTSIRF